MALPLPLQPASPSNTSASDSDGFISKVEFFQNSIKIGETTTTPFNFAWLLQKKGSEKTLIDVVRFYNRGGNVSANLDERMHPLNLSEEEINELVEFMRTLTGDDVLRRTQSSKPQTRTAVTIGPFKSIWKDRPR